MKESGQLFSLNELVKTTADFLDEKLDKMEVEIFSHGDADGIASSALLVSLLYLREIPFHLRFTPPFGIKEMIRIGETQEKEKLIIFLDQGSSEIHSIEKCLLETGHKVVVIDHHPCENLEHPSLSYLNSHLAGVNGGTEISTAGLTYLVVERLEKSLRKLIWLAIVGALGDRQELDGEFVGINRELLKRALDEKLVTIRYGLKLVGRRIPLFQTLLNSIRPYMAGITNSEEACEKILKKLGVEKTSTLESIGDDEKVWKVISSYCGSDEIAKSLWGPLYYTGRYLHEEANIAQACGIAEVPEVALGRLLSDPQLMTEAETKYLEYARKMISILEWLRSNPEKIVSTKTFKYVYLPAETTIAGEILSLALESRILSPDLPILALVDAGHQYKVSGRVPHSILKRGYHIGRVLGVASRAVGGAGGGHEASGAAYIPKCRVNEFIQKVDQILGGNS